jgi:hypothetical protein
MSSLPKSERGYFANTRKLCNGNLNGFLYALVKLREEPKFGNPVLSFSDDEDFHLNNVIAYIGITNNPIARLQAHRAKSRTGKSKGRKIGMVIFKEAKNPAEGKMLESVAIYNYCEAKGYGPEFQSGHDTWAGA